MDTRSLLIRQQIDRRAYADFATNKYKLSGDDIRRRNGWNDTAFFYNPAPFQRGSVLVFGASGSSGTVAGQ